MKKLFYPMILIILSVMPILAQTTEGNWKDFADTAWADDYELRETFTLSTPAELAGLALLVNESNCSFAGKNITLTDHIDLSQHYWTPIGRYSSCSFQGSFFGEHHTISGLLIGNEEEQFTDSGLFGIIQLTNGLPVIINNLILSADQGSTIHGGGEIFSNTGALAAHIVMESSDEAKELVISNCINQIPVRAADVTLNSNTGGLIGSCIVDDSFSATARIQIEGCRNEAPVYGALSLSSSSFTGGIVGNMICRGEEALSVVAQVVACQNDAPISGASGLSYSSLTGGITGSALGNIAFAGCINRGTVIGATGNEMSRTGGLAGEASGENEMTVAFTHCINSARVVGSSAGIPYTGGLVGFASRGYRIDQCVNSGNVKGAAGFTSYTGGLLGYGLGLGSVDDSYSVAHITAADDSFAGGLAGGIADFSYNSSTWSNNYAAGSITGESGSCLGGVVGRLQQNMELAATLHHCLAVMEELTGEQTDPLAGMNVSEVDLNTNYAFVAGQTEPSLDANNRWTGYMSDMPIADWNEEYWMIDPTDSLMPALRAFNLSDQEVKNPMRCLVAYSMEGGMPEYAPTPLMVGELLPIPDDPQREGHLFAGWFNSDTLYCFDTPVTQDLLLSAAWIRLVTVTFDLRGGEGEIAPLTIEEGTVIAPPDAPTRHDHLLQGWFTDPEGLTPWDFESPVEEDLTLYASWRFDIESEEITVDEITPQHHTGKAVTPIVILRRGDQRLIEERDYEISYLNNFNIGTATIRITGQGDYAGIRIVHFEIVAPPEELTLTIEAEEGITTLPAIGTHRLEVGQPLRLTIRAEEGYTLEMVQVFLNEILLYPNPPQGISVSEEESQLLIETDILTEDTHIRIEGASLVGINAPEEDFILAVMPQMLAVDASKASTIRIVRLNGVLEIIRPLTVGSNQIPLPPGTYIVSIADQLWKVCIMD